MMRCLWLAALLAASICVQAAEQPQQPGIGELPPTIGLKDRGGNVIDLAVGVVIGAAFGKIVTALVDGIIMPAIGAMTGGVAGRLGAGGRLPVGKELAAVCHERGSALPFAGHRRKCGPNGA